MGGLLLFVFIALCMLGAWRVFVATKPAAVAARLPRA